MATKQDDVSTQDAEFAAAFDEEDAPRAEQTEDQAFGLDIEEAAAEETQEGAPDGAGLDAVVIVADGGADDGMDSAAGTGATEPTDPEGESAAAATEGVSQESQEDEPTDPKDIQRKKSWEGRLRKLEAELKAKADAIAAGKPEMNGPADDGSTVDGQASEALEQVADQAEADGDTVMADKVDSAAEMVESGEMSPAEAMKMLAEDFGEPFVKMIEAIAKSVAVTAASEKVGEIDKKTTEIIDHLRDSAAKSHFKTIHAAHPDFREVAEDPAFEAWKAQDPERARISDTGTADEINDLLSAFKAESAAPAAGAEPGGEAAPTMAAADEEIPEDELDAAEGVRSTGGLQLPQEPTSADDYAGAWNDFEQRDRKAS